MARNEFQVKVELSGPFFTKRASEVVGRNVEAMMADVAQEMEGQVRQQIAAARAGMPGWTGHTLSTITGRVHGVRSGKRWHRTAVVSALTEGMDAKEAIRTKAAAAGIERRFRPFRRVTTAGRSAVKRANLTQGIE